MGRGSHDDAFLVVGLACRAAKRSPWLFAYRAMNCSQWVRRGWKPPASASVIPTEAEGSLLLLKFLRATVKSVVGRGLSWLGHGWEPPASAGGAGLQSSETRCQNMLGFSPGPFRAASPSVICHPTKAEGSLLLSNYRRATIKPVVHPGDLRRASIPGPSRISTQIPPTIRPESATPS